MAVFTLQQPSASGAAITYTAVGASNTFANNGGVYLHVKNGSGSPTTVTFVASANACSFGFADAAHNLVVTVNGGADKAIGPFDPARFNDGTGTATVTISPTTSITAALLR